MRWQRLALITRWLEGGRCRPREQGASTKSSSWRGCLEGFAHWRLNHLAFAELRRRLLGAPAPNRDDFYAHPQRGSFPASQGSGTL